MAEVSPEGDDLAPPRPGTRCILRTERGLELATALAHRPGEAPRAKRALVRVATEDDLALEDELDRASERAALRSREHATRLGLELKVLAAETLFSRDRFIIYYAAEDRLDLRELARALERDLDGRIELRQLGARERARTCGGAGVCGRTLCCTTFLRDLEPVTLRMAKVQGFSLAPEAVSGACGRLKCCLRYENPVYDEARAALPRVGAHVEARRASGEVVALNVLTRQATVRTRDGWLVTLYAAELAGARTQAPETDPETDTEPRRQDSRWRGITERLKIFRRRSGKITDPPGEDPSP
jgi:cell fate regulator YaaT (PSP1 superfamily)